MKSDNILLNVRSSLLGNKWYKISRFLDYDVSVDMDTDTDQFSFTFDNPDSIFKNNIKFVKLITKNSKSIIKKHLVI